MTSVILESQIAKALADPKEWKILSPTEKNLYEGMAKKIVKAMEQDITIVKEFTEKKLGEALVPTPPSQPTYDDACYI